MSRSALFLPSCRGGGFGHINRCLALARALERRGWEVTFALEGQHATRIEKMGMSVQRPHRAPLRPMRRLGRLVTRWRRPPPSPAYLLFTDMSYQIVRDGFYAPDVVRRAAEADIALVRRLEPDVLIGDTWPLTHMVGIRTGLPVVQIIKTILHPQHPDLYWWDAPPPGLISPDVRPAFNPVLESWGMAPIRRAEDTLQGDLFIVPGIPTLDPLPDRITRTHYVGALIGSGGAPEPAAPEWLDRIPRDRPLVYITMGGGAEPVDARRLCATLYASVADAPWQVILSTGQGVSPDTLPHPPKNVIVRDWVPGTAVIRRSALVVYHGGYGTTMELVRYGVPAVVLPFHSEQESNGRRLEACGAAKVLSPASNHETMRLVHSRWPCGEFTTWIQPESPLTPDTLHEAIAQMLTDPGYHSAACALKEESDRYGGVERAGDLIESLA